MECANTPETDVQLSCSGAVLSCLPNSRCVQEGAAALPREAVVIRGGNSVDPGRLAEAFQAHFIRSQDDPGAVRGYCISVNGSAELSLEEIAMRAKRPNGQICSAAVGAIEDAGFVVVPSAGRWHKDLHCDVYLATGPEQMPAADQLAKLSQAFDSPVPNPARK